MKDFYKTHPSGSGKVTKIPPSTAKIKPIVTNDGTGAKPRVPDVTEEESSEKSKFDDNVEGDENKGMDDTSNLLYDDVDVRLNDPFHADEGFVQKAGTDAEMKTKVPVTSSSYLSDLTSKLLNFADIPHTDAEIVSPMDVHVQHKVPSRQTPTLLAVPVTVITESSLYTPQPFHKSSTSFTLPPPLSTPIPPPTTEATNPLSALSNFTSIFQFNNRVSALEKEVSELRKDDPLKTQVTALVNQHLDSRLEATRDEFMSFPLSSITARITYQVKIQLP
ncbi:hypothetical protein Tco_0622991 [Tanacetum coccineum]